MYGVWSETPVSDGQENVGEVTMRVIGRMDSPSSCGTRGGQ